MILYPHEFILEKLKRNIRVITALIVGSVLTLITGVVSYWMIANQQTTQTRTAVDVAQPTAFSYAPAISAVCMFLTALAVAFYYSPYDGEKI